MDWSSSSMIQNPYVFQGAFQATYQGVYAEMPSAFEENLEELDYVFPQDWYTPDCRSVEQQFLKILKTFKRIVRQQAIFLLLLCALFIGHFACFYYFLN